jgi:hypothetical protein
MKSIIALSVLFVAQAAAKIGFGACPIISNTLTYSDYKTLYDSVNPTGTLYNHKLVYGDKVLEDLLGLAKTFVSQVPKFKCGDLFPQALYYASADIWNPLFKQPPESFVLDMLGYHVATNTEALYYCVDTGRLPGIIRMIKNAGLPIPQEVIDIYS